MYIFSFINTKTPRSMHPIFAYYQLEWKILLRKIKEFGIHPIIAIPGLISAAILFIIYLFNTQIYASFYLFIIGIITIFLPINKSKQHYLKNWFINDYLISIKLINRFVINIPIICILFYNKQLFLASILIITIVCSCFSPHKKGWQFTLPSPFKIFPFPISNIYRSYFFTIPCLLYIYFQGIIANNSNLSFAAILGFMVIISFGLFKLKDNSYNIWIHNDKPNAFLWHKIKIIAKYTLYCTVPFLLGIAILFNEIFIVLLGIYLFSYIYLIQSILIIYANKFDTTNIFFLIIFALSIYFPPFLIATIPYFYLKAISNIKELLPND